MLDAIITYTVTPCPSCGVLMSGTGTVTRNGSDLWDGLIWCDPGRSIKGKEFWELAKLYAGRDMRQTKEIGFLFQWNRAVGI